jgi:hypothetical protein
VQGRSLCSLSVLLDFSALIRVTTPRFAPCSFVSLCRRLDVIFYSATPCVLCALAQGFAPEPLSLLCFCICQITPRGHFSLQGAAKYDRCSLRSVAPFEHMGACLSW